MRIVVLYVWCFIFVFCEEIINSDNSANSLDKQKLELLSENISNDNELSKNLKIDSSIVERKSEEIENIASNEKNDKSELNNDESDSNDIDRTENMRVNEINNTITDLMSLVSSESSNHSVIIIEKVVSSESKDTNDSMNSSLDKISIKTFGKEDNSNIEKDQNSMSTQVEMTNKVTTDETLSVSQLSSEKLTSIISSSFSSSFISEIKSSTIITESKSTLVSSENQEILGTIPSDKSDKFTNNETIGNSYSEDETISIKDRVYYFIKILILFIFCIYAINLAKKCVISIKNDRGSSRFLKELDIQDDSLVV